METNLCGGSHRVLKYPVEMPKGMIDPVGVSTGGLCLPAWAPTRWRLAAFEERSSGGIDPYVIYDRWGYLLYQWPDNHVPSPTEISKVCADLIS